MQNLYKENELNIICTIVLIKGCAIGMVFVVYIFPRRSVGTRVTRTQERGITTQPEERGNKGEGYTLFAYSMLEFAKAHFNLDA